ncbi:TrmB family transcriptional regulator sugar-binding domain-containing protein [Natrinema versiforme]|uniref:TrmB family transcriptional regulator n=1 Tax=Natrinema versiforme TaxID=88724 RepID=A0A4P8WR52_9EURY|nr:TrmB family transcriptional regulator sugar-binding domain-containing protein [Natrinema versiforme]QCS45003.1 TrmB family transcriptional regulator [Natrinema versiforme]
MPDEELSAMLKSYGLTDKEVDTYLTILEDPGETTASTVANEAGVSKRHVYNTAVRLEEKNLVEINDFVTPTILRPTPPERVEESLHSEVDTLTDLIDSRFSQEENDIGPVEVLKSRTTFIKRMQQLIDSAEEIITIAIPPSLLSSLSGNLEDAVERGTFVLLVVYGSTLDQNDAGADLSIDGLAHAVRIRWDDISIQLTVDSRFGLIAPRDLLTNPEKQSAAVAFGQSYLEPVLFGAFLGDVWKFSEEIYTKPADNLPETYTNFLLTTSQAALHANDGHELHATVEARSAHDTSSTEQLEGRVMEIQQQIVEPTSGSALEHAIDIRTDDGVVSIGGEQAVIEDYEAVTVRLDHKES